MELLRENPIAAVIVACELGLWVALGTGLVLRYLLRKPTAGAIVLAGIPLLDVVLLTASAIDLHRGTPASGVHGLAAVYLGTSLAFGPSIVRAADVRFAHRFAGGPPPVRHAPGSPERRAAAWQEWRRAVLAASIASAVILLLVVTVVAADDRRTLLVWIARVWEVVAIWLVVGPGWEILRARRRKAVASEP